MLARRAYMRDMAGTRDSGGAGHGLWDHAFVSRLAVDSLKRRFPREFGVAAYSPQDAETIEALLRSPDRE